MIRNFRNAMVLLALVPAAACGRHHAEAAAPQDPIAAIPLSQIPTGSLAGTNVLLLTVGGVALGDSVTALEAQRTQLEAAANAILDTALRRDAREVTWEGLPEQRHESRLNPTLGVDPDRLPTSYLIAARGGQVPDPLWGNIRTLAALLNARFAIVPAAVKIAGTPGHYVGTYVFVALDARTGQIAWRGRMEGRPSATPEAALASAAAGAIPNPLQPHITQPTSH